MLFFPPEEEVFIAAVTFNGGRDAEAKQQITSLEQIQINLASLCESL